MFMKYIKEILFHHSRVQLYEPFMVRVEILSGSTMSYKETKEINDAIGLLSGGKEIGVLVVADETAQFDKKAREFSASPEGLIYTKAEALIVKNLGQRITANFYLKINRPARPAKAFASEKEAVEWLMSLK